MTLRTRLTLWNAGILGAALILSGLALLFFVEDTLSKSIDQELEWRATRSIAPRPARPGGPPGIFARPRARGQGEEPTQQAEIAGLDETSREILEMRRPRQFRWDDSISEWESDDQPWIESHLALSLAGETVLSDLTVNGRSVRIISVPAIRPGGPIIVVQAASELDGLVALQSAKTLFLGILVPVSLLVAISGGLFLMRKSMRPVEELTWLAERVSESSLDSRLDVRNKDEFGRLALTFNGMMDRLSSAFQSRDRALAHGEKLLESQKQFTADASHEMRTPLTRIKIVSSGGATEPAELIRGMGVIDKAADQMSQLLDQLLYLGRVDAGFLKVGAEQVDIESLCKSGMELTGIDRRPDVELEVEKGLTILAETDAIYRALTSLMSNAARHTPDGDGIAVLAKTVDGEVVIEVRDGGGGIRPEHLSMVTERFYRADSSRTAGAGGAGLGLAIATASIESVGGVFEIESEFGKGTVARLRIPIPNTGDGTNVDGAAGRT